MSDLDKYPDVIYVGMHGDEPCCADYWNDRFDPDNPDLPEYRKVVKNRTDDTTALIGFLAAKLACHAPDDPAVQWALEWLEKRG